jgi:DNA (cytosine-5)-methyltransferase 1
MRVHIDGLIIDNFAGGGGASTGIELAVGRSVDVAINHDPEAVALHAANHPATSHYCQSVWKADPQEVVAEVGADVAIDPQTRLPKVGLAWFSPDCKHFSKAKGGKPVEKGIRDLAWVVVQWAQRVRPAVIMLENVEEFQTWGPIGEDGRPDPAHKGKTFEKWVRSLRRLGYRVNWKELRACDYGAPTSRKRLFLIARSDKLPIVWPRPTHGKPGTPDVVAGKLLPWRTAASIIDWSIPCPSIFERSKPLADATCRRIAAGIKRYVLDAAKPFIVPVTHHGSAERLYDVDAPIPTVTAAHRGEMAFVTPTVISTDNTSTRATRAFDPEDPLRTITSAGGGFAAVAPVAVPFVSYAQHGGANRPVDEPHHTIAASTKDQNCVVAPVIVGCGGRRGQSGPVDPEGPYPTTTAKADVCVVAATMVQQGYGEREGQAPRALDIEAPLGTVVAGGAKHAVVQAFMAQHNSDAGGRPRAGRSVEDPVSTLTSVPKQQQVVQVVAAHMEQANTGVIGHDMEEPVSTIVGKGCTQRLVASSIVKLRGTSKDGQPSDEPLHTISAGGLHHAEVRAFMVKYYGNEGDGHGLDKPIGTVTTKDRFGVVTVDIDGEPFAIVDIGMRMLSPRELYAAQGFPASYIIDPVVAGKPLTKTAQIRMCGNSVCPPMAEALVRANFAAAEVEQVAA